MQKLMHHGGKMQHVLRTNTKFRFLFFEGKCDVKIGAMVKIYT